MSHSDFLLATLENRMFSHEVTAALLVFSSQGVFLFSHVKISYYFGTSTKASVKKKRSINQYKAKVVLRLMVYDNTTSILILNHLHAFGSSWFLV